MRSNSSISEPQAKTPLVAIVGNPNAGKTTLFNSLTGSHQKVGNYPGVTVERVTGTLVIDGQKIDVVDVPGLYSLAPVSEDERVAVDAVLGRNTEKPDLLVCVIDAHNLERNLFLFTQVAEAGIPTIVALTMVDRVTSEGFEIDYDTLGKMLTVDVVGVVGHKERGMDVLKKAIAKNLATPVVPDFNLDLPQMLEDQVDVLLDRLARAGADFTRAELRRAIVRGPESLETRLPDFPEFRVPISEAHERMDSTADTTSDADARYAWTARVQKQALRKKAEVKPRTSTTDRIDAILTHRVFGLIAFTAIMYIVFLSIYKFATPVMDLLDNGFQWLGSAVGQKLEGNEILRSLVVDGVIAGVGGMLVFLPQILILFFFIGVLEGSGYLARAAFLMDRLLGWCGLNGRAFIPLLSSFACAIPGIMAARVMPDPKSRLATILVAPLMSCSARLPVYLILIGAFIQPRFGEFWAGFALFAMHFLGLVVAIPIAWLLNRKMLKGRRLPFMLELPPYQWPKWKDVGLAMLFRGQVFVKTAGTMIVAMSILIWALSYFPRMDEASYQRIAAERTNVSAEVDEEQLRGEIQLEQSILGRFGKAIEPVFIPAGFDWRITTAILSAFPARETVVPSLGILFSLGGEVDETSVDLRDSLQKATWPDGKPLFTEWTAIGLMVFFALCAQCMATLAAVKRETNSWKWAVFMFAYMTALAYIGAVGIHQLSKLFPST